MRRTTIVSGDQLSNTLHTLGVNFILGGRSDDAPFRKQPAHLIAALAESDEARLRLSLIPLFLERPDFARHVRAVAAKLSPAARLTIQCYYTAAVWLGQKYQLDKSLPDYFSNDLAIRTTIDPEENLRILAQRHKELSGAPINWLGTYQHAEQVWQKGLEYRTT